MNGWRLADLKYGSATATNTISARTFTATRMALSVALSRVPAMSSPATTAMMKTAGRLKPDLTISMWNGCSEASISGAWVIATGKFGK